MDTTFFPSHFSLDLTVQNKPANVSPMTWNDQFLELFRKCLAAYQNGNTDFNTYYSEQELQFLASIGYKPRELFDFVEDFGDAGVPTESTALLIAAARRDYFHVIQKNVHSSIEVSSSDIPSKSDTHKGVSYLKRIIKKAELKLRGELDPNLMFCCAGDRRFLREHGDIHPADFLRHVWAAEGDIEPIYQLVTAQ